MNTKFATIALLGTETCTFVDDEPKFDILSIILAENPVLATFGSNL